VLQPFIADLAASLLVTCLFDRETNVRRAAAAAYQENVGRLGTVPHGIAVIGKADFFAVGNRSHAYMDIAPFVAQFDAYQSALVAHLVDNKLCHWDPIVRQQAAAALGRLTQHCATLVATVMVETVVERVTSVDLAFRHGAVLALGYTIRGLMEAEVDIPAALANATVTMAPLLKERGYLRGMSGVLMRQACGVALRELAAIKFRPIAQDDGFREVLDGWMQLVVDCLVHSDQEVQVGGRPM
jgi:hypothetical protein